MTAIHDDPSCGEKGEGLRVWKLRGTRGASMLRRTGLDALLRSVIPRVLNGLSMPKRSAGTIIGLPGAAPVRSPPSSYAPRLVAYGEGCPFSAGSRGPTTGRCSALRVGARLQDTRIIRLVRSLSLFHHRSRLSVLRRFARIHRPVRFVSCRRRGHNREHRLATIRSSRVHDPLTRRSRTTASSIGGLQ